MIQNQHMWLNSKSTYVIELWLDCLKLHFTGPAPLTPSPYLIGTGMVSHGFFIEPTKWIQEEVTEKHESKVFCILPCKHMHDVVLKGAYLQTPLRSYFGSWNAKKMSSEQSPIE